MFDFSATSSARSTDPCGAGGCVGGSIFVHMEVLSSVCH